jgi:hypothetical protein
LKKWALENPVPGIIDKEKDAIDDFVLDVFEVHVPTRLHSNKDTLLYYHKCNVKSTMKSIQEKKIGLVQKDDEFIKRILDAW